MFVQYYILTLLDGEVAHGEGHGVAREDVVPAVDVLPVDGESSSRQKCQDPPGYVWRLDTNYKKLTSKFHFI